VRTAQAAKEGALAVQQQSEQELANRRQAEEVLAGLDHLLETAADSGRKWAVVWYTQNHEATWDSACENHTGLEPTSVAALLRDACIQRGYKVRSYWNIVIDFSGGELPNFYDDDSEFDGAPYVGG
jgi:PAS domain-containing protein